LNSIKEYADKIRAEGVTVDVLLVIAGPDDGYLDILIQQIKISRIVGKVLIVGEESEEEKIEAYVDADVLVYPCRLEIFGLVQFKAIMCGTPVLCQMITDGRNCEKRKLWISSIVRGY
jgi:glycosyltransferase involved in cell wall biosynthesis